MQAFICAIYSFRGLHSNYYNTIQYSTIVGNKAQISVLTYRFINILTSYLRKVEKFAFAGLFSKPICQTCSQRALMGSGGSKQAGTGLWIAK